MGLIVQKFGGTSVGSIERIKCTAKLINEYYLLGHQMVVVLSAMSGETNRLLCLAKEVQKIPDSRELDLLLSTGEQVTISILSMALKKINCKSIAYTGWQAGISTCNSYNNARIVKIDNTKIKDKLDKNFVVIVAGFQGINKLGDITTLGRGGSDTTAVALAASLKADECQIYTDVDGIYTCDPRIDSSARRLDFVSYEEMLELSGAGSKVLNINSVEFAYRYKVPLRVLSSFINNPKGTLITEEKNMLEENYISGIATNNNEGKISFFGIPDEVGMVAKIIKPLSENNINVDMIVQSVSENEKENNFAFTVQLADLAKAKSIFDKLLQSNKLVARKIDYDDKVAKLSLVGMGIGSYPGIFFKVFDTLSKENINIQMISTSEVKISIIINEKYLELATRSLHKVFNLD